MVGVRRTFRLIGYLLIALIVVVVLAAGGIVVTSNRELDTHALVAPPTPTLGRGSLERGKHLYTAVTGCIDCHGADGGGGRFIDRPAMAVLNAPNLTRGPGGVGTLYSDQDYDRAIRRGIRADGTRLLVMPSWSYAALSDDDAAALIAYLRALPPVDRATPRARLGPVGRYLVATRKLQFDAVRIADEGPPPSPPPPMLIAAYGGYLARIGGCMECHGAHLSGGHFEGPPDVPAASNLTPTGIGSWDDVAFMRTLTTAVDPSGHRLHPFMPWRTIRNMTDDELEAIYQYLHQLPPRPNGQG